MKNSCSSNPYLTAPKLNDDIIIGNDVLVEGNSVLY